MGEVRAVMIDTEIGVKDEHNSILEVWLTGVGAVYCVGMMCKGVGGGARRENGWKSGENGVSSVL